jgi:hypothetical protein
MAAKYPNLGDGSMTMQEFLFHGSDVYFSLSESEQARWLLFERRARRSPGDAEPDVAQ